MACLVWGEKGIVNYSGALGVSKNYFTSSLVENPLFEFNEALGYDEFSSTVTEQSELKLRTNGFEHSLKAFHI